VHAFDPALERVGLGARGVARRNRIDRKRCVLGARAQDAPLIEAVERSPKRMRVTARRILAA